MKKVLFIILVCSINLNAQTRIFLNIGKKYSSSTAPTFYTATWQVTTGAERFDMATNKDGSTIASKTSGQVGAVAIVSCLIDQFISAPLKAQTITGTLDGQIRFNYNVSTSTTGKGKVIVRVINTDNSVATEVGSMSTTNLTTTLTNRTLIQINVGTLNITTGQRLVIELGWIESVGTNTTRTGTASRGSSAGVNLAVDNTTTTANDPWILFSQTIQFAPRHRSFF
jgi:hypothetical protein